MKVLCTDGTAIGCDDFKAVESGVVLLDEQRDEAIGFVPSHRVEFVLPDGYVGEGWTAVGEPAAAAPEEVPLGEPGVSVSPRAGEPTEGGAGGTVDESAGGTPVEPTIRETGAVQSVELGLLREQVEALQARLELLERWSETGAGGSTAATGVEAESGGVEAESAAVETESGAVRAESGTVGAESTAAEAESEESELSREIDGLGSTYAERLAAAGIETVGDLAAADPETVASAADTATGRAENWIEQARRR